MHLFLYHFVKNFTFLISFVNINITFLTRLYVNMYIYLHVCACILGPFSFGNNMVDFNMAFQSEVLIPQDME